MQVKFISQDEMIAIPALEISDLSQIAPNPLVSVVVLTYNHEDYIGQNIEGILEQQCDFPIEVIIGEDKSTDRTYEICQGFQQKYPDIIRLVSWHENVGLSSNLLRLIGRARGKYLAYCEGDDYWIDPDKLNKQIRLMEQSLGTSLCGARTRVVVEGPAKQSSETLIGPERTDRDYAFKDVVHSPLFHSSTCLFRRSTFKIPQPARGIDYLDHFLQCTSALQGNLKCLPDVVSVYRRNIGGMYVGGSLDRYFERRAAVFEGLLDIVNEREAQLVNREMEAMQFIKCHHLINDGRIAEARLITHILLHSLCRQDFRIAMILLFHLRFPKVYALLKKYGQDIGFTKYVRGFAV